MTSDLWKLREWLTIDEAAVYLSSKIGQTISGADVLRLAIDGQLKLSVNLPSGTKGMFHPDGAEATTPPTSMTHIEGLWDVSMEGAGRLQVEHQHHCLAGLPYIDLKGVPGAWVERAGVRRQLVPVEDHFGEGYSSYLRTTSAALSKGSDLGVRIAALDALAAQMKPRPASEAENSMSGGASATEPTTTSLPILTEAGQQGTDAYLPAQADQEAATPDLRTTEARRAAVKQFLQRVYDSGAASRRLTKVDFWTAAGEQNKTDFYNWQSMSDRASKGAHQKFSPILAMEPTAFVKLLHTRGRFKKHRE